MFSEACRLKESSRNEEAVMLYKRIIELDPLDVDAHNNLGDIYYTWKDYKSALTSFTEAVKISPRYCLGHFNLACTLEEIGLQAEAIKEYLFVISLNPHYANAHYNLALAYENREEPRKALPHWKKYAKLDSGGRDHDEARRHIEKIMSFERLRIVSRNKISTNFVSRKMQKIPKMTIVNGGCS